MNIPRKLLGRRAVLRGMGTAMALPLLEAMLPNARAAEAASRPKRLQTLYSPNGMIMQNWRPAQAGRDFVLSPTLQPFAPFRERLTVISGLASNQAVGPAGHGRSCPSFLTGVRPRPTEGSDLQCGISVDQVVAQRHAEDTQLTSLELGIDPPSLLGSCDINYSCTYTNTLSWSNPTTALPVTVNPRVVFELLFGDDDTLDETARLAQLKRKLSILDFVREDANRLSGKLGTNDRRKLDQYLESVRDIERRVHKAAQQDPGAFAAGMTRPAGIPEDFGEHVRLMIDLQVLAMQADLTRVGTFMIGRELSNRTYAEIGVPEAHHMLSHHDNDPQRMAKLSLINRLHMQHFAYYLDRMAHTPDGEGSLLDSTMVLIGCAFGDSNTHDNLDLPVVVAGGSLPGGQHLVVPRLTPMSNLHLTLLHRLGIEPDRFGESSGVLAELAA
jgi:Protein of unknown function (DUF1552)